MLLTENTSTDTGDSFYKYYLSENVSPSLIAHLYIFNINNTSPKKIIIGKFIETFFV